MNAMKRTFKERRMLAAFGKLPLFELPGYGFLTTPGEKKHYETLLAAGGEIKFIPDERGQTWRDAKTNREMVLFVLDEQQKWRPAGPWSEPR